MPQRPPLAVNSKTGQYFNSTLFLAHKLKMFTGSLRMGSPGYSLAVLV